MPIYTFILNYEKNTCSQISIEDLSAIVKIFISVPKARRTVTKSAEIAAKFVKIQQISSKIFPSLNKIILSNFCINPAPTAISINLFSGRESVFLKNTSAKYSLSLSILVFPNKFTDNTIFCSFLVF